METSSEVLEELEESRPEKTRVRLESILGVSPAIILVFSRNNQILYASRSAASQFDTSQDEMIGKTWRELGWPSEIGEPLERERELVFQSGHSVRSETKFLTKRGWWNVKYDVSPIKDKKGNVKMVVVTVFDINQLKKIEEALSQIEDRYRCLVEQSTDGILLVDEDATITEWNHGMETITGIKREEAIGKPVYEVQMLLTENPTQEKLDFLKNGTISALQTGEGPTLNRVTEGTIKRKTDGMKIWVQQTAFPIKTEKGFKIGSFFRDITQWRRREELDRALGSILAELVSSMDLDKVMNATLSAARNAIGCDSVVVAVREGDKWVLKYGSGIPPEAIGTSTFVTLDTAYAFITSGRAMVVDDTEFDNRIDPSFVRRFGIKSQMSMPIRISGKTLGALVFLHTTRAHPYSEEEINFATQLSASLSLVVENMQLFESEREQRSILQAIVDNSPTTTILVDGQTYAIKLVNETLRKNIERFRTGNIEGELTIIEAFPTFKESILSAFHQMKESGAPTKVDELEFEMEGVGKTYWNNVAIPISTRSSIPDILVVSMEVTELVNSRKRVEELAKRAEEERARLQAILGTIPAGVMICASDGRLLESNDYLARIFSGPVPIIRSRRDFRLFKAWWADSGIPLRAEDWGILRAIERGDVVIGDVLDIEKFDGSRGTILNAAAPILNESGKTIGGVAVILDITPQRRLEHEAIEAREKAELYLDLLTHDIRNLNTAASGYLQLLSEKIKLEKSSENIAIKATTALEESTRLIENVQKMQRIEFHEVKQGAINLSSTIEDVIQTHLILPRKQVTINFKPSKNQIVIANELLTDVFSNLIGNAIKHSNDPVVIGIIVGKAYEHGREYYKIIVEDDGPGIPDEMKGRLFSRLTRGRTKAVGSGLGLYLVRRLVEDYQGRVWVEDRVAGDYSKGARFVVMLPVAP